MISNDTDLVMPIRMVTADRNQPVLFVFLGRWQAAPGAFPISRNSV